MIRPVVLANLFFVALLAGGAAEAESFVSFETSYTQAAAGTSAVWIGLRRFEGGETGLQGLSVVLRARWAGSAGGGADLVAYFPEGSREGACVVWLPAGVDLGAGLVGKLEIVGSPGLVVFGRKVHLIRRLGDTPASPEVRIHAVVFAGVGSPRDAVDGGGRSVLVHGGIVALGGESVARAVGPARVEPRKEYSTGEWVPPLSPVGVALESGPWNLKRVR